MLSEFKGKEPTFKLSHFQDIPICMFLTSFDLSHKICPSSFFLRKFSSSTFIVSISTLLCENPALYVRVLPSDQSPVSTGLSYRPHRPQQEVSQRWYWESPGEPLTLPNAFLSSDSVSLRCSFVSFCSWYLASNCLLTHMQNTLHAHIPFIAKTTQNSPNNSVCVHIKEKNHFPNYSIIFTYSLPSGVLVVSSTEPDSSRSQRLFIFSFSI